MTPFNIQKRHVSRASQLVVGEVYHLHGISSYKETIPPQIFQVTAIHTDHIVPYINCRWWINCGFAMEYDDNRQMYISDLFKTTLELEWIPDGKLLLEKLDGNFTYRDIATGPPPIGR